MSGTGRRAVGGDAEAGSAAGKPPAGPAAREEAPAAAGGGMADPASVVAEVVAEAARLRESGALTAGFEEDLDRRFLEIASDPDALARAAAAGASRRPARPAGTGVRQLVPRLAWRSKRTAGSIARSTRRAAGPRARAFERSSIEGAGRLAELIVTRGYVTADRASRLASGRGSALFLSRLARISPVGRALPPAGGMSARRPVRNEQGAAEGAPSAGSGGDIPELEAWALERLSRSAGGVIVHAECGDGALLRRLGEMGFESAGADPAAGASGQPVGAGAGGTIERAGAFEFLGGRPRSSLGGLLLTGVTERLSPGRARALAHLAASRLRPGGVVVVLSAQPDDGDGDVVSSDLRPRRPIHPVTWCHLFSRYGLAEMTVYDPVDQPRERYAVAARRPAAAP